MKPITYAELPPAPWFEVSPRDIVPKNNSAISLMHELEMHLQTVGIMRWDLDGHLWTFAAPNSFTDAQYNSVPEVIAQWLEGEGCIVDRVIDGSPVKSLMCRRWL